MCLAMSIAVHPELFQCQQAEFMAKVPHPELVIVVVVFPLQLHAAAPHPYPRIQFLELPTIGRKVCGKVVRRSPDDSV